MIWCSLQLVRDWRQILVLDWFCVPSLIGFLFGFHFHSFSTYRHFSDSIQIKYCYTFCPFNSLFSNARMVKPVSGFRQGKRWWGFGMQWHQLDHVQTICASLGTDNYTNTSSLNFCRPDALPDAQPTVSKHWRQISYYSKIQHDTELHYQAHRIVTVTAIAKLRLYISTNMSAVNRIIFFCAETPITTVY